MAVSEQMEGYVERFHRISPPTTGIMIIYVQNNLTHARWHLNWLSARSYGYLQHLVSSRMRSWMLCGRPAETAGIHVLQSLKDHASAAALSYV